MPYNIVCQYIIISKIKKHSHPVFFGKNAFFIVQFDFYFITQYRMITCTTRIPGTPSLNFKCRVLCRNTCIPANAPIDPPITARKSSVLSGTLHCFLIAFLLSIPYTQNVSILITIRYITISFQIIFPVYLPDLPAEFLHQA